MQMDEAALEELLKSKQGSATGQSAEEAGMEQHAQNLTGLAAKFEDFIQGKGDVEGALFDEYVVCNA